MSSQSKKDPKKTETQAKKKDEPKKKEETKSKQPGKKSVQKSSGKKPASKSGKKSDPRSYPAFDSDIADHATEIKESLQELCDKLGEANQNFTEFRMDMPNSPSAAPFGLAQSSVATATDLAHKAFLSMNELLMIIQQVMGHLEAFKGTKGMEDEKSQEKGKK